LAMNSAVTKTHTASIMIKNYWCDELLPVPIIFFKKSVARHVVGGPPPRHSVVGTVTIDSVKKDQ
jgi:hypothetical protein